MSKVLLTGSNHIITANSPRNSTHEIVRFKDVRKLYIPERTLQNIWTPLKGVSLLAPLATNKYDLIHSFNAIPYTNKPWIVTFESKLPRTIGYQGEQLGSRILNRLLLPNCRKIIAMSHYAKDKFVTTHQNLPDLKKLTDKLEIFLPNFPVRTSTPKKYVKGEILEITFVGNHFARKGGIVALRIAEKAKQMQLPIKVNLISAMNYGPQVYTDCLDKSMYTRDITLLDLDNVVFHQKLPNNEVMNLLAKSHFQVMCTLDDTYGFSILEGFSVGTPAITTNVCALPEIVNSNNGLVVDLELNQSKNWIHLSKRTQKDYWSILDETYELLSTKVLESLVKIIDNPEDYEQLSIGAIDRAKVHDSKKANEVFDNLYKEITENS